MRINRAFADYLCRLGVQRGWDPKKSTSTDEGTNLRSSTGGVITKSTCHAWKQHPEGDKQTTTVLEYLRALQHMGVPFQYGWLPVESWTIAKDEGLTPPRRADKVNEEYNEHADTDMDLDAILAFESDYPELEQFWVILPQSLVFSETKFADVMLKNVARGVSYLYIIKDSDDEQGEIGKLARTLARKSAAQGGPTYEQIRLHIRCLRLPNDLAVHFIPTPRRPEVAHVLIGNPHEFVPHGVRIKYHSNRPTGGSPLPARDLDECIALVAKSGLWNSTQRYPGAMVLPAASEFSSKDERIAHRIRDSLERRKSISERSPTYDPSAFSFSAPGNCHFHIDVAGNHSALVALWAHAADDDHQWKISTIAKSLIGQQALTKEFALTYLQHDPHHGQLDYFLTVDLSMGSSRAASAFDRTHVVSRIRKLLPVCQTFAGVAIEVERVVARLIDDAPGQWDNNIDDVSSLTREEIGVRPGSTHPYEIHHGFSIVTPDRAVAQPISLNALKAYSEAHNISLGGYFVFYDGERWVYRTNCFCNRDVLKETAQEQHNLLRAFLLRQDIPHGCAVVQKTVVEQILGIWNMSLLDATEEV